MVIGERNNYQVVVALSPHRSLDDLSSMHRRAVLSLARSHRAPLARKPWIIPAQLWSGLWDAVTASSAGKSGNSVNRKKIFPLGSI